MRFIIGTRLFAYPICGFDADSAANDETLIKEHADLAIKTMVPSLANQTDQDFEHFTLVNKNARKEAYSIFTNELEDNGLHTVPVTMKEWSEIVAEAHSSSKDGVCIARIDDDDCIFNKGVELAKSHHVHGKSVIYGWTSGLRYRIGSGCMRKELVDYGLSGHHSILQTCVLDPSSETINPYWFDHSNVRKWLSDHGYADPDISSMIVNGDADANGPAFIYVRGKNSVSTVTKQAYDDDSRFDPVDVTEEFLKKRFGIKMPLR